MNEKIKQLAQNAGSIYDPQEGIQVFNKEKFAQLIIKECAQVLLANKTPLTKDYDDEWYAGYNCAMNNSIYYIHKHFGVEE